MPTPIINIYQPNLNDSLEKRVKDLTNSYIDIMQHLKYLMDKLDSKNVKRLATEYTKISSDKGETTFDGPLITMRDKQVTPVIRLQMGYDPTSERFVFKLRDTDGNNTLTLSDLGQILLSGKPLFEMYDADDVLRLKMGYDADTGDFVFELYNAAGDTTVGIDDSGNGTFTGSIAGGSVIGSVIKTAASGNDRIELTGSGLVSYNESNQKEGVAIEAGLYGFSKLVLYVAGAEKGGLNAGGLNALFLESTSGNTLNIASGNSGASDDYLSGYWNCILSRFEGLKNENGYDYVTDNWVQSQGYITGTSGATGSFTTADGKTVTVADGLITSIV
jgi:hypothetical protein